MVEALLALVATLAGFAASGLVIMRVREQRRPHLIAWSVTVCALTMAFLAMTAGGLAGYSEPLFRIAEFGAALLAPVSLAVGVVLLLFDLIQVRFAALLVTISFMVVATSVLLLDPIQNSFDKSFPSPDAHYHFLVAGLIIEVAQVLVVTTLVVCAAITATRVRNQDRAAVEYMIPVVLVVLSGVLAVAGSGGYLPGPLAVLVLGAAVGLVGYGAIRTAVPEQPRRRAEPAPRSSLAARAEPAARAQPTARSARPGGPPPRPRPAPDGLPPRAAEDPLPGADPTVADLVADSPPGEGERMYGQITVFTLVDGRTEVFDQLAAAVVQAARTAEPGLLVFSTHDVAGAPNQRIFYQLFRDRASFEEHQRLPHVRQFLAQSRRFVSATNVIELALNSAKVVPVPVAAADYKPQPQPRGY